MRPGKSLFAFCNENWLLISYLAAAAVTATAAADIFAKSTKVKHIKPVTAATKRENVICNQLV